MTPDRARLLYLRVLALRNARVAYEPHRLDIGHLCDRGRRKMCHHEARVNWLAWHYRRQLSPELVPYRGVPVVVEAPRAED